MVLCYNGGASDGEINMVRLSLCEKCSDGDGGGGGGDNVIKAMMKT